MSDADANGSGLADVYVECLLPPAEVAVRQLPKSGARNCLALHRVCWLRTLVSNDSRRVLCHFRAPDAEAVRVVLRRLGLGIGAVWVDGGAMSRIPDW